MKKDDFVNPDMHKLTVSLSVFILFCAVSCGGGGMPVDSGNDSHYSVISCGQWAVKYDDSESSLMHFAVVLQNDSEQYCATDSLHFQSAEIPDSLSLNRRWLLGGGSVLVFSILVPAGASSDLLSASDRVSNSAVVVPPKGLRSVYLSDRSGNDIDDERASFAVEPPPRVTHYMGITYSPENAESCLIVIDSMVVDFSESNIDSMVFHFAESNSAVITDAGRFGRGSGVDESVCFADTAGLYSGVFISALAINRIYTDSDQNVTGQSRLTSAFLTGRGFYPTSSTTESYQVEFDLPDSITAWVPLIQDSDGLWRSSPGGIEGGLPVAIGNYRSRMVHERYSVLVLDGGTPDSLDSISVESIARTLSRTIYFPSAQYSFVEIFNPDGPMVIPGFGGLLFSRGSLGVISDVSDWDDQISIGETPAGSNVVLCAAEGMLAQSLQLDPVLKETLRAWFLLRYYAEQQGEGPGLITLREACLKYYLYNTEVLCSGGSASLIPEYSLADPYLLSSPLRSFITCGKGVVILEYLYSRRMLNRLPYLLQNFTHSSSGNYWLKIYSSLRIEADSQQHKILRNLFYLPGIPQISVAWEEEDGRISFSAAEIQPGETFDLPMDSCMIFLGDTSLVREITISTETGGYQCSVGSSEEGHVTAIDLNYRRTIPADFMYRRSGTD